MIIKNILSKVSIHPLLLFVALSSIITGLFKDFLILFSIIIIHELGHIIASLFYRSEIDKIHLYPFGGNIKTNDKINRPLREELIIVLAGPSLQIIYFLILSLLHHLGLMNTNTSNIVINYHYSILFFNLLPIYPLDGSKILNIVMSKLISFKKSHLIMIYTSYVALSIILLFSSYVSFNLNIYMLLILLLLKLMGETKNHESVYNKFLLERYLHHFHFKKTKVIIGSKLTKMMRDKRHLFMVNNKEVTENEMLRKRYKNNFRF